MTSTLEATTPDFDAVKQRQQQTWASGDFAVVAARIVLAAEQLVDDYVPALLERGRRRAAAEGLQVELIEADAESLPFPDGSFDAVTSVYGAMFAPNHEQTAAELLRVVRPGGTIALANWTPEGFIGELFRTVSRHVPPPAGVASPLLWGTEAHLRGLFGDRIESLEIRQRAFTFRFGSPEQLVGFFRTFYGPTLKAFAALEQDRRDALYADLVELVRSHDRLGTDATAVPATYIEAIAVTR
jgi:SAM-dependent methyltransferase